jgi:hypothetical protein
MVWPVTKATEAMPTSKSQSAFLLAIIIALIFVSVSISAAELKAQGYTTPAYIDIEFSEYRVSESDAVVAIQLIRSGDYRQTSTIEYQTSEIDTSEGQDYKGAGGTITFQPGESYKTITLEIISDETAESPESFAFQITSADPNSVITRVSATVWIEDAPLAITQPRLEIVSAPDGSVLLSWDATGPCALERSANPAAGLWESVPCTPMVEGTRHQVTQPLTTTLYFYRLRAD